MEDVDERYENGVIYMIKHKTDETKEFYIGSSYDLKARCGTHKTNCNNENSKKYNYKVYKYIRENGGWEAWNVLLLYDYSCKNRKKLELEEQRAVKEYKSTLNKVIPCRTIKEWYDDNRDKILQQKKECYVDNKEKIVQKSKKHYEANKEKILQYQKEYGKANKEKIAQYKKECYEDNRDKILQQRKEYGKANKEKILQKTKEYQKNNKEKIAEKRAIKINCDICNAIVCKYEITRHKKTQKCKNSHK